MTPALKSPHSSTHVLERYDAIMRLHKASASERTRIRRIMKGGRQAILALLGENTKLKDEHLPVVNMMHTGMSRLAQSLGHMPDVKVDPPVSRDSDRARDLAQERENAVHAYDDRSKLELKLPLWARWVPGYGYGLGVVKPSTDRDGNRYPHVEIRNSYDVYPGWWGPELEPTEVVCQRQVDAATLARKYPAFQRAWEAHQTSRRTGALWWPGSNFEGPTEGDTTLVEFFDVTGTYLFASETRTMLDFIPNPLGRRHFVTPRRLDFDALSGQWDHVIGLMALMAKLNILGYVAAEDSVFRETNIIGDMTNANYQKGRFAVNHFPPGVQIEKAQGDVNLQQTFAQIDRVERQLRIQANYSVVSDSQSPNSFVTGQGLDRLTSAGDENVREYQKVLRHALQDLDSIRLEWDETMYGGKRKPLEVNVRGKSIAATYDPASFKGSYRTRRVYGVMAGFDDASKIVTGLQLLQGRIIDRRTFQENLDGLENLSLIEDRIMGDEAMAAAMRMLEQRGAQGDPAAAAVLVEMARDPGKAKEILMKFFTPEEPQMSPEEQAFLASGGPGGVPGANGPPPDIATVLSRLDAGGDTEAGVQTVGRL